MVKDTAKVAGLSLVVWGGIASLLIACGVLGLVIHTAINTNVTQPLNRLNKNHNADWCIAQQQDLTASLTDFQAAQQRIPVDKLALSQFVRDNGAPGNYAYGQQQEYNHLELVLTGDYQAEVRLAAHYNSLTQNPDVLACFPHGLTTGLPDILTADQPTA